MNIQNRSTTRKYLATYLVVVFVLSYSLQVLMLAKGGISSLGMPGIYSLMWIPGIVAIIQRLIVGRDVGPLGWKIPRIKWWLLAYFIPVFVCLLAYGTAWLSGLVPLEIPWQKIAEKFGSGSKGLITVIVLIGTLSVAIGSVSALGEEIGWRGLMVPLLVKSEIPLPLFVSGFIWGLWHAPLILFGDYAASSIPIFSTILFILMTTMAGYVYGMLRLASSSLWPAVIMHASHNAFFQTLFDRFSGESSLSSFIVGESGLFPLLAYGVIVVWLVLVVDQRHILKSVITFNNGSSRRTQ